MRLRQPHLDDYRPLEGSAAEAYGCRTFDLRQKEQTIPDKLQIPATGNIITGVTIEAGGLISEDTTWDADLVLVVASVEVAENASLSISPGTTVEFAGFFRLLIRGRLWAVGEADNRIHFTATTEQQDRGWDGIEFLNIPAANDSSRLEHCHVSSAVAESAKNGTDHPQTGGAISIVGVNQLTIASCEFEDNRADYGAAVYCGYGSSPVIAGNLFHNNTATLNGSAVFNVYSYPKLINNTIVDNVCLAESDFHLCGAVENFNGKIPLINNIIRNNFTNHYSGAQLVESKDYYTTANNIEGYVGNATNLDCDPGFYGEGKEPYQLVAGSSSIDAGINHVLSAVLATEDISGNPRICDLGIDLGAYEYCGELSPVGPSVAFQLLTCVPNPFNPRTQIIFELPHDGPVNLSVYDLKGRLVRTLIDNWKNSGRHEVIWNGCDGGNRNMPSGTYLYCLQAGQHAMARTMTLVR